MKLHRFTAINNQKAMLKVHETLGPDALIYSTRTVASGVEIMAGLPLSDGEIRPHEITNWPPEIVVPTQILTDHIDEVDEVDDQCDDLFRNEAYISKAESNFELIDKLNAHLERVDEKLNRLSKNLDTRYLESLHVSDNELTVKKNLIYYHLSQLGFRGKFCNQFMNYYLRQRKIADHVSSNNIETALLRYIKTTETDLIDEKNVCALIGPTGAGKTTTIAKIASRYIAKYGTQSIGLITLDYQDVATKNHLFYYSNLFNIDLQFASDRKELSLILASMAKKNLVLIDTGGVSQRDSKNVSRILDLIESQGGKISSYLTMPCNIQEPILDEVVRAFASPNVAGCILTKQDECINIAPALSISMNYKLPVAYICNGRNVNEDIHKAIPEKILQQITKESIEQKILVEDQLIKNTDRVQDGIMES